YINLPPPHGASAFPVGTMIVEARESGSQKILVEDVHVHAKSVRARLARFRAAQRGITPSGMPWPRMMRLMKSTSSFWNRDEPTRKPCAIRMFATRLVDTGLML